MTTTRPHTPISFDALRAGARRLGRIMQDRRRASVQQELAEDIASEKEIEALRLAHESETVKRR